jgi:hypothetical protein
VGRIQGFYISLGSLSMGEQARCDCTDHSQGSGCFVKGAIVKGTISHSMYGPHCVLRDSIPNGRSKIC